MPHTHFQNMSKWRRGHIERYSDVGDMLEWNGGTEEGSRILRLETPIIASCPLVGEVVRETEMIESL